MSAQKAGSNYDSSQTILAVRNQTPILKVYKEKNRTKYNVEIIMVLHYKCKCTQTSAVTESLWQPFISPNGECCPCLEKLAQG